MRFLRAFIDTYEGDGWRNASKDKEKPMAGACSLMARIGRLCTRAARVSARETARTARARDGVERDTELRAHVAVTGAGDP